MKRFNILDPNCPFLGAHLLEASAGTGKTFTIEHVVVRLVLENIPITEILAVTFTKASTRELKERIFGNLQKALLILENNGPYQGFDYLQNIDNIQKAKILLFNAMSEFDESQIFTIHGFCYRMLKEFSFEANILLSIQDPDHPVKDRQKLQILFEQFWTSGIDNILCPEQIKILFSKHEDYQSLCNFIAKSNHKNLENTYEECFRDFQKQLLENPYKIPSFEDLLQEFSAISINYKSVKGDFLAQLQAMYNAINGHDVEKQFRQLILHQGTIFDFLSPENKKVKIKEVKNCNFLSFFSFLSEKIKPLIESAVDRKQIEKNLSASFKVWLENQKFLKQLSDPDEILLQMRKSLDCSFVESIQQKYKAIIVDEFQDTDPIQFDIFYECFIKDKKYLALYLVGDPKQSIYRFRNADVYTFLKAKQILGDENVYHLDTNFRSTKELVNSLNVLFSRNWLSLPKIGSSLQYLPVLSGSKDSLQMKDGKKSLHWMIGSKESSFDETFLPYAAQEILQLNLESLSQVAILVKDRYEANFAQKFLLAQGIACVCKSHEPIAENFWFQSLKELLYAVFYPHEEEYRLIYEKGPFCKNFSLVFLHDILVNGGLSSLFSKIFDQRDLHSELKLIIQEILDFETREGFSILGCVKFLQDLEKCTPEDGFSLKDFEQNNAVQIMTLHISKGLEFDFVFALALASKAPKNADEDDEIMAEKLRQLYVAMTRAKKRLYVPWIDGSNSTSAIDLFAKQVSLQEGCFKSYLEKLTEKHCISTESVVTPFVVSLKGSFEPSKVEKAFFKKAPYFPPLNIESFSSLAKTKEKHAPIELDPQDLPKGKETGVLIHEILEKIFSTDFAWKDAEKISDIIVKSVKQTPYEPFVDKIIFLLNQALNLTLSSPYHSFSLKEIERGNVVTEFEFLYEESDRFMTGFIDLVFVIDKHVYIVDWKTNVLKDASEEAMMEAMQSHDYLLQASIYQQAMARYFGSEYVFAGVFYFFLRTGTYQYLNALEGMKNDK